MTELYKIEDIKNKVALFSDNTFGKERPFSSPLHHLKKEIDEALESDDPFEFADMLLLLLDSFRKKFPNLDTQDLLRLCDEKLKICLNRKWGKPDENGVIEHIR